ncbi:hypothetical protein BHM03_00013387 [Ensete ventricosum]|uniref:Uncharacterized protein n=1 Tax=Ensete ventricosum TaxID=4639 RepID=A0A445ME02_ENSVE|nr:hypothetical protein BHM03_00013387 [Ensete ventricosum]
MVASSTSASSCRARRPLLGSSPRREAAPCRHCGAHRDLLGAVAVFSGSRLAETSHDGRPLPIERIRYVVFFPPMSDRVQDRGGIHGDAAVLPSSSSSSPPPESLPMPTAQRLLLYAVHLMVSATPHAG